MSLAAAIISIVGALVYLALLGLALTTAGWIGGRLFRLRELTFGRLLPVGLLQALVAGFSLLIVAQVLQLSPFAGTIITVVLVLLIGLGELRLTLRYNWKAVFKPWGVMAIFQVVLGIPAALLFSLLVPAVMNLLFPAV
jgi:hypothetical protein